MKYGGGVRWLSGLIFVLGLAACTEPVGPVVSGDGVTPPPIVLPSGPPDECFDGMEGCEGWYFPGAHGYSCDPTTSSLCVPRSPTSDEHTRVYNAIMQMLDPAIRQQMLDRLNWGMIEIYDWNNGDWGDAHWDSGTTWDSWAVVHLWSNIGDQVAGGPFGGPQELFETLCHEAAHIASGQADEGHPAWMGAFSRCMTGN
jgi:hypothetical protein